MRRVEIPALVKAFVDWLHLSAAILWLGAIFTSPLVFARALGGERETVQLRLRARYIGALSPVAWSALATLAVTGVIRAAAHLENGWGDLIASAWGRLLLAKLAAVALMVAAGAYAAYRLVPQLTAGNGREPRPEARTDRRDVERKLHALSLLTAALGFVVLFIVTLL